MDKIKPIAHVPPRFTHIPPWAPRLRGVIGMVVGESPKKLRVAVQVMFQGGAKRTQFVTFKKEGKAP